MQKAYSLQPQEHKQLLAIEEEHKQLLARYGATQLDRKQILKAIPVCEEKQRSLMRDIIARQGVTQFNAARFDGANVIVDVPDEPVAEMLPPAPQKAAKVINGAPAERS
jgi:hypothetical protein